MIGVLESSCRLLIRHALCRLPRRFMASDAEAIFTAGLRAVQPSQLVAQNVEVHDDTLHVGGSSFALNHNIHIVGFGKAALGLVNHIGNLVTDHVITGVVSCPNFGAPQDGTLKELFSISPSLASRIQVFKGPTNNVPNDCVLEASKVVHDLVKGLGEGDLLLTVITGGGSALLTLPAPELDLTDVVTTTRLLANAGCDIVELNTVRKQLDLLKGGGLSRLAQPAQVVSLILSDVIGDPLDIIAAGPTVENSSGPKDAFAVLEKYQLLDQVPRGLLTRLKRSSNNPTDRAAPAVNFILGSNRVALAAAAFKASQLGYTPVVLTHALSGQAEMLAKLLSDLAVAFVLDLNPETLDELVGRLCEKEQNRNEALTTLRQRPKKLCVLAGGEATVKVPANPGSGGRAAQMALAAAQGLERLAQRPEHLTLLIGATDGLDGPTEMAGAWVTPHTMGAAAQIGLDASSHLRSCDAYGFFRQLRDGANIRPGGLTGTNVMDVVVLTLEQ